MTMPIESFMTAATRGQEAFFSAMQSWTGGMQAFSDGQSALAEAPAMMGRYFEAVHQVLDSQRQFVETMLNAAQTAQTFTTQAIRAAESTAQAMNTAAGAAEDMTTATLQQTKAAARVAKTVTG